MLRKREKLISKNKLLSYNMPLRIEVASSNSLRIRVPKKEYYSVMLRIAGVDIFHFTDDDKSTAYRNFGKATKALDLPYKYIFANCTLNLSEQQRYINHKLKSAPNDNLGYYLERELKRFEYIEQNHRDRVSYLIIYGETESQAMIAATRYIADMQDTSVSICNSSEQLNVFADVINHTSCGADAEAESVFEQIFPSKIEIGQRFVTLDDKKMTTCITAYEYPVDFLNLQFASIFAAFDDNVIITLDCQLANQNTVRSEISATMRELKGRRELSQTQDEQIDSESDLADISNLYAAISRGDEQIVATTLRFYVAADNITQLEYLSTNISKELENIGIKCFVAENEMLSDMISMLYPSNKIGNYFPIEDTFKHQYPFYYQSLTDKSGFYFGETTTQGQVIFNPFLQTNKRTSYDILIAGVKGSGKTVTLKSMVAEQLAQGSKVYLMDLEAEYINLAERFGGKVLKMNRQTTINPLQLYQSVASNDTSEESNFTSELSRIEIFFRQYITAISEYEITLLMEVVELCLSQHGITEQTNLAELSNSDYPIMSDLLSTLRQQIFKSDKTSSAHQALEKLEAFIKQLAQGAYSTMFNGVTTLDISKEQLVVFDVKDIAEQTDRVFNAYLTNILALMWAEMCKNVGYNLAIDNPYDRRHVVITIEEAHRYINTEYVYNFMVKLLRRSRKYDAALWFASQAMADYNGDSSRLFSLVQYKMLLKQTAESLPLLIDLFPQFTKSELAGLENFQAGEMLLSIDGKTKLHCRKIIADEDFAWLGNSRDKMRLAEKGVYI